jgi:predicted TIM-barrel fold metal-dependent hydrolase
LEDFRFDRTLIADDPASLGHYRLATNRPDACEFTTSCFVKYLGTVLRDYLRGQILGILLICAILLAPAHAAGLIDYHQHLFSQQALSVFSAPVAVTAADLIAQMDSAGIDRAVVLSTAYGFSNPFKNPGPDEYAHVRAENEWVSMQVAMYPGRLIGFCAVNPLRDYALQEIERCSKDPNLRTGLKLHFGNSDVNLDIKEHVQRTIAVFAAANRHGMAIVVHAHANIDHNRPYGAKEARVFLEALLPAAPSVTVQIAHLAGGGKYARAVDEAVGVYAHALQRGDPRVRHLFFDASILEPSTESATLIVKRMRQIGMDRILFGSDMPFPGNGPREYLERWRKLPLTPEEFQRIESNIAPYLNAAR